MAYLRSERLVADEKDLGGIPHIILGKLYPAMSGKLLNGATHSGDYGTEQADGQMYYYTDIKGSDPIDDPRIGAHYGSQRHNFRSLQLRERETANHGKNVYSIDGRGWARAVDGATGSWVVSNNVDGQFIFANADSTGVIFEVVGYFNDINFLLLTYSNRCDDIDIYVNGTQSIDGATELGGDAAESGPMNGRSVGACAVITGGSTLSTSLGTTPRINTLKYEVKTGSGEYLSLGGIELISQDTTSDTTRSLVQIPKQNVVSFGKKFTVQGKPHYDPFNGFVAGSDVDTLGNFIDTATSLGMQNWKGGTANYYRPFQGGRVVRWVDNLGQIKTSVNMVPPNAQNITGTQSNLISHAEVQAGTNGETVNFGETLCITPPLQSEVARTFYWSEFGNGSNNSGAGGTYADASTLHNTTVDNIAYVMDDGLTHLTGYQMKKDAAYRDLAPNGTNSYIFMSFIGTGLSGMGHHDSTQKYWFQIAQNLPYGTHVLKILREGTSALTPDFTIDGVACNDVANNGTSYGHINEFNVYQPKMPPIPEEAVIISDYMLMADFVPVTGMSDNTSSKDRVSKGVRCISSSRDVFHDSSAAWDSGGYSQSLGETRFGMRVYSAGSNATAEMTLAAFGHGFSFMWGANPSGSHDNMKLRVDTLDATAAYLHASSGTEPLKGATSHKNDGANLLESDGSWDSTGSSSEQLIGLKDLQLGLHKFTAHHTASDNYIRPTGFEVATPIHTSSHYQPFKSPTLWEIVGGDRNIEQNNLVVTSDGRTWDEITREDTSYISDTVMQISENGANFSDALMCTKIMDWRGQFKMDNRFAGIQTDIVALNYDRYRILKPGFYQAHITYRNTGGGANCRLVVNQTSYGDTYGMYMNQAVAGDVTSYNFPALELKRGDFICLLREGGTFDSADGMVGFSFALTKLAHPGNN